MLWQHGNPHVLDLKYLQQHQHRLPASLLHLCLEMREEATSSAVEALQQRRQREEDLYRQLGTTPHRIHEAFDSTDRTADLREMARIKSTTLKVQLWSTLVSTETSRRWCTRRDTPSIHSSPTTIHWSGTDIPRSNSRKSPR